MRKLDTIFNFDHESFSALFHPFLFLSFFSFFFFSPHLVVEPLHGILGKAHGAQDHQQLQPSLNAATRVPKPQVLHGEARGSLSQPPHQRFVISCFIKQTPGTRSWHIHISKHSHEEKKEEEEGGKTQNHENAHRQRDDSECRLILCSAFLFQLLFFFSSFSFSFVVVVAGVRHVHPTLGAARLRAGGETVRAGC